MGNFAVLDKDNKVENTIVADSKEIAEEVTGLACVEYTDANPAIIGLGYADGVFEQPPMPEPTPDSGNDPVPE
jgi:hypothetical protein